MYRGRVHGTKVEMLGGNKNDDMHATELPNI